MAGIAMGNDAEKSHLNEEWEPPAIELRDAGRPMFRIDTTLDEPIRTSIPVSYTHLTLPTTPYV